MQRLLSGQLNWLCSVEGQAQGHSCCLHQFLISSYFTIATYGNDRVPKSEHWYARRLVQLAAHRRNTECHGIRTRILNVAMPASDITARIVEPDKIPRRENLSGWGAHHRIDCATTPDPLRGAICS